MSFLSYLAGLWRHTLRGLHYMNVACRVIEKMNTHVQASNATAPIKTASTALKTAADSFCVSLQAFHDDQPGE